MSLLGQVLALSHPESSPGGLAVAFGLRLDHSRFRLQAVEKVASVPDLHATLLHLLEFYSERLT
jgi:hypothetical protein